MTYQRVCNYINTTGDTSGAGTAYPSWGPEFTPIVSGVRVTRSLVLYVCFVDRCLSFCPFSFGHCVACSSSIYGFWLPFWYLQVLLILTVKPVHVVISIRQLPFSCPVIENCIWIQSLSRVACLERNLFLCAKRWPFNTGLIIIGDGCDLFCSSV